MFSCYNLTITRNNIMLLQGLGFSLLPGSCLILNGKNGIGKTTLLRTMAGLRPIVKGNVLYEDIDIHDELSSYHQRILYLPHLDPLIEELDVWANLTLWARIYDTEMALIAAIRAWDIENLLHQKVSALSQGQKKKVHLTKLLLSRAKIWFLDEPFTHLDQEGREMLRSIIATKRGAGGMIILSLHDTIHLPNTQSIYLSDFAEPS
jgi:heme exporter protein A